jgi:SAM-dependent methyltransferase
MQRKVLFGSVALLAFVMMTSPAPAQEYQPSVGQEGKDVIWVPTPEELIAAMLDMAKVNASDYLVDLGSGDGRIVIAAAKRGARGLGIEFNPDMVDLSRKNALKAGVSDRAAFIKADIFEADFSRATIVTTYLLPDLNLKLMPKLLAMKPGTRVVTHAFSMGEWEPDQTVEVAGRTAFFWVVPAKVQGTWTWRTETGTAELSLTQTYQKISGTLKLDGKAFSIKDGKLVGDHISFVAGSVPRQYDGRVVGDAIEGITKASTGSGQKWNATHRAAQ